MDEEALARLQATHPAARRWVVAYSGGMDSHVLLDLCARHLAAAPRPAPALVALHVDHGVHPDSSRWAAHCAGVCAALDVPLESRRAEAGAGARSEDQLRRARYGVFEAFCQPGDLLLLAHHLDDQAETVLLRLLRGAGAAGLGGMPAQRPCGAALLCRPLLAQRRADLREYAGLRQLAWIEDPSNAAPRYGRNHLRLRVLPLLEERWPGAATRIARAAAHSVDAAEICAERAAADLAACARTDRFGQVCLALAPWRGLSEARRRNLLREWLRDADGAAIDTQLLETLQAQVIDARADRQPRLVIGQSVVRRFDDALYLLPARRGDVAPPAPFGIAPGLSREIEGVGRVALLPERAGGVRAGRDYRIGFRSPGMSCRLAGRPEKPLKQLMQEAGVPPWLRDRVPMLWVDGELAAIAELGICEGFAAGEGAAAVSLSWKPLTT